MGRLHIGHPPLPLPLSGTLTGARTNQGRVPDPSSSKRSGSLLARRSAVPSLTTRTKLTARARLQQRLADPTASHCSGLAVQPAIAQALQVAAETERPLGAVAAGFTAALGATAEAEYGVADAKRRLVAGITRALQHRECATDSGRFVAEAVAAYVAAARTGAADGDWQLTDTE